MDWAEILILDRNEEDFENGIIRFPLVCDAQYEGLTAEEFYNVHCTHDNIS